MAITDWPEAERPREKLLAQGPVALSDAELLAIFLRTGTRGRTAVDLARELLREFGGLRPLLNADQATFIKAKGLGNAKYVQLQAVLELSRRHLMATLQRGAPLSSPKDTFAYLSAQLRDRHHEAVACIFLDNRNHVITYEELFYGTIDGSSVHPRVVVKRALEYNAAALIMAHNHPSGVAEPSSADEAITRRLKEALALIDVRLLDHIIVGDKIVSLADRGVL